MYVCVNSLSLKNKTKASKSLMGLCVGKKTGANLHIVYPTMKVFSVNWAVRLQF